MVRLQYLPDSYLGRIPSSFYANPVGSPFPPGTAKVYAELRHPGGEIMEFDDELLRDLLREGIDRHGHDYSRLDMWLAPRVHCAMRVPRRIAADRRFWAWVAVEFGRDYVKRRWTVVGAPGIKPYRFTGTHLRNGISRLWWGAELCRNGRDYAPVADALSAVRIAQFALELRYSWYRPAAIAFARICKEHRLDDDMMNHLSVRVNAYLGTRPVELVGLDEKGAEDYDHGWWGSMPPSKGHLFDGKLEGPDDGHASPEAIGDLMNWFGKLLDELQQRGVSTTSTEA